MLDELHVQNVALIREAMFAPAQGLTVVTGETGAGKTALLSAIKLLVGERARTPLPCVRARRAPWSRAASSCQPMPTTPTTVTSHAARFPPTGAAA